MVYRDIHTDTVQVLRCEVHRCEVYRDIHTDTETYTQIQCKYIDVRYIDVVA